ncbi:MAG: universal stress protein [Oligoflexia bacterium]|nr:universal stress protein [Oligoflexia bacterium]
MSSTKTLKKIVWAINPFDHSNKSTKRVAEFIEMISSHSQVEVEPVYVLASDQSLFSGKIKTEFDQIMKKAAEEKINEITSALEIPGIGAPQIISQAGWSTTKGTTILDEYAQMHGAELIIVSTHGRKRLARAVMGSFAETLLLTARTPVLVISPQCRQIRKYSKVLFPTDFSESSRETLNQALLIASQLGAKVTVFNVCVDLMEPLIQAGALAMGGGWVAFPSYSNKIESESKREARKLVQKAKSAGVPAQAVVKRAGQGIAREILSYAKTNWSDIIVMAAQSGPLASTILGSETRKVIRQADCPVLVVRNHSVHVAKIEDTNDEQVKSVGPIQPYLSAAAK